MENLATTDNRVPMREVVSALQQTLQRNHLKILEAARRDWEQKHTGGDPSDSCASVRIAPKSAARKKSSRKTGATNRWSPS